MLGCLSPGCQCVGDVVWEDPAAWNSSVGRLTAGRSPVFSVLLDMKGFNSPSSASDRSALTLRVCTGLRVDPFKPCFFQLWIP